MIGVSHKSDEYHSEGWLGTGGFAAVERVRHRKSAKVYARKIIKLRPPLDLETCRQEITVMNKLSHRHVVPLVSSEILPTKIELVLPLADGDLATYLGTYQGNRKYHRIPDEGNNLKKWIGCLASGLSYLHGKSVRHKDIKPDNILTTGDRVLYTDFGVARDFTDPRFEVTSGTPIGTPLYYAPEVALGKKRGKSADVFSLGCVYLEILVCLSDRSFKEFSENRFGPDNSRIYHANIDAVLAMLDSLIMENNDMGLYPTFVQCKRMMHEMPLLRPSSQSISNILCTQARIGCKECLDEGEEEKTAVIEIPGFLGPRAVPKSSHFLMWIFGIHFAYSAFMLWYNRNQNLPRAGPNTSYFWMWRFGILFACSAFMLWYNRNQIYHPPLPSPSIKGSKARENQFATRIMEISFPSKTMDLEVDATPSPSTPQKLSSPTTAVQQSIDKLSGHQPVNIAPNHQQRPRPPQSLWKRWVRKFMLEFYIGLACFSYCMWVWDINDLFIVSFLSFIILLLWGQHGPSDFWEMSTSTISIIIHLAALVILVMFFVGFTISKTGFTPRSRILGLFWVTLIPYVVGWTLFCFLNWRGFSI